MSEKRLNVVVLMASFNGSRFIEKQIQSIFLQQRHDANIRLIVSDDNSTDNTLEKVRLFASENCYDITCIQNESGRKGHVGNFANVCGFALSQAEADLYLFSDQDDEWAPDKLSRLVKTIGRSTHEGPFLLHTDLSVVDEAGEIICESFARYQTLPNPNEHGFFDYLYSNVATGCTFIFNKKLLELAHPIPLTAVGHDWWFALVAKFFGNVRYLDEPLVKYRQHRGNTIGATGAKSIANLRFWRSVYYYPFHLRASLDQAESLKARGTERNIVNTAPDEISEFCSIKRLTMTKRLQLFHERIAKGKPLHERLFLYCVASLIIFIPSEKLC